MPGIIEHVRTDRRELGSSRARPTRLGPLSQTQLCQLQLALRDQASAAELSILILHLWHGVDELAVMELLGIPASRFNDLLRSLRHRINQFEQRRDRLRGMAEYSGQARFKKASRYTCPSCGHVTRLTPRDGKFCEECAEPLDGVEADQ